MTRHILIASLLAAPACLDGDGTPGAITAADAADSVQLDADPTTASATPTEDATVADDASNPTQIGEDVTSVPDSDPDTTSQPDTTVEEDVVLELPHFSFFVTSLAALQELSESDQGFGGDLRFGEEGMGAGLRGADLICATIAESSMPGAGAKPWRAFLSATQGEDGQVVNAIDRIGEGPWYDRLGRTFALTKADLMADRPTSADAAIKNDFPNELGVPNHRPDPTKPQVDNHDTLTGSNDQGKLYGQTATCNSWTGKSGTEGKPRVGHSWPRSGGPGGPGPGGHGDMNGANWMSSLNESGCAPGINLVETGGPDENSDTVGSGGGYGGFYCFSLVP